MIRLKKPIARLGKDEQVLRIPAALLDREPFGTPAKKKTAKRKPAAAKKTAGKKRTPAKRKTSKKK